MDTFIQSEDKKPFWLLLALVIGISVAPVLWSYAHAGQRSQGTVIGSRPAGCPTRFCGCALAIKIFGAIKPNLNLAVNWRRFPRTAARPGAIAVRSGHVMQLVSQVQGSRWLVWDPNSGGGKIRIHERVLTGAYTYHDPFGTRVAGL